MIELKEDFEILKEDIYNAKDLAVFLDFDGTISPIVPLPENAYLSEDNRNNLLKISKIWPVAIITGRDPETIKEKIGLEKISYGASHGLEWEIFGESGELKIEKNVFKKIDHIREKILLLKNDYKDLIVEDKKFSFAFHYQLLNDDQKVLVKEKAEKILSDFFKDEDLRIFRDRETVEILPNLNFNKGDISKKILDIIEKKTGKIFLPIYIGDTSTDEDAFKIFRDGITIKVGYSGNSCAEYFFKDRNDVDVFVRWLSDISKDDLNK
jgi:trehalose-phosphatase